MSKKKKKKTKKETGKEGEGDGILFSLPKKVDDGAVKLAKRPEQVYFTRKLAKWYLSLSQGAYERKLKNVRVLKIARALADGSFAYSDTNMAVARRPDGSFVKINGNHISHARMMLPEGRLKKITLKTFRCDTEEDERTAWVRVDGGGPRTLLEQVLALIVNTPGFKGVTVSQCEKLIMGFRYWKHGNRVATGEEIGHEMTGEHLSLCLHVVPWLGSAITAGTNQVFRRQPVYAAIFLTYESFKKDSDTFWAAVFHKEGTRGRYCPASKFRDLVYTLPKKGERGRRENNRKPADIYNIALKLFKAWHQGKDVTRMPSGDKGK